MNSCTCVLLKRLFDREIQSKLLQLLMGLNSSFENVKSNVRTMEPMPTINKVLGLLQKVEKQNSISDTLGTMNEANAYASIKQPFTPLEASSKRLKLDTEDKPIKICTHCKNKGHDVTECYQLQTCTFCGVFGHVERQCYQGGYGAQGRYGRGRGRSNSYHKKGNNVYKRTAANNADAMSEHEYYNTDPAYNQAQSDQHGEQDFGTDALVDKVVQKVIRALADNTAHSNASYSLPSTSFAGITSAFTLLIPNKVHSDTWIVDLGASDHMTSCMSLVHNVRSLKQPILVGLPDGSTKLDPLSKLNIAMAKRSENLYLIRTCNTNKCTQDTDVMLLHQRLGHSSFDKMRHLPDLSFSVDSKFHCEVCIMSKHHKLPFPVSKSHAKTCFSLINLDVWGPYRVKALSGATSFLTILDDYSETAWTFLIQSKDQVPYLIKDFLAHVENQFNAKVQIIRTDHGTEFLQGPCREMFNQKGI
ncbi:uncharacterized protein LOC141632616 [Silene latifolia]|uniref:uncharacterized protein LOC141632616 n=1 Tax=Silene latifolia TaxID=37657 RepID=UPI003D77E1FA